MAEPPATSTWPASDVVQVAWLVTSAVVESAKVARAVSATAAPPAVASEVAGVTAIEVITRSVTVATCDPVMPADVAVIEDVPAATAVRSPVAEIVVTDGEADAQVEVAVRSAVLPSEYVPVAVSWSVAPRATEIVAGPTAMDARVFSPPLLPPQPPAVATAIREPRTSEEPGATERVAFQGTSRMARPPAAHGLVDRH